MTPGTNRRDRKELSLSAFLTVSPGCGTEVSLCWGRRGLSEEDVVVKRFFEWRTEDYAMTMDAALAALQTAVAVCERERRTAGSKEG